MLTRYHKLSFWFRPDALLRFAFGDKKELHRILLFDAAKKMLGDRFIESEGARFLEEIETQDFIPMNEAEGVRISGNRPTHFFGKFLYFILRCMKPDVVVESGVSHGASSWNILNALHKNGKGKLISIDLPDHDTNFNYNMENFKTRIGWVVPDVLKSRWDLRLGDSKLLLPGLMKALGSVDVFFHDSDHSYDFMKFEFAEAYPYLRPGGLIISDDVHAHAAFQEFAAEKNMEAIQFNAKGGVAVK